ncbi:MAG: hypothetical protein DRP84_03340 [Spirochaetes bacterium]|nr:MAG: hypothetical protein DRP84_03340 [Spirochaetota bacterium]
MLLCFDYDGVISDSVHQLLNVAKKTQKKLDMGREPTLEDFKTIEYLTFDHFARKIEIPEDYIKLYSDTFFDILTRSDYSVKPFPKIIDILKELSKNHRIVIITANLKSTVFDLLKENNAEKLILHVFDERDPGDKTEKIMKAIEMFNEKKSNTAMIGDTISDIRYGKAAGVTTIAVTWGFHSYNLLSKENPDFIADNPVNLFRIIDKITEMNLEYKGKK